LQSERNASLLIDVLRHYVAKRKFQLQDFVVMPDHVHLLLTVQGGMTVEKAMQLIKGSFSYRLKNEFGFLGEVWQPGFSEVRVDNEETLSRYRAYIARNPVRAGFAREPNEFPFSFTYLAAQKAAGARQCLTNRWLADRTE
jgi:putative transposase